MTLEIQVLARDKCKNVAGINWLIGFQPKMFQFKKGQLFMAG